MIAWRVQESLLLAATVPQALERDMSIAVVEFDGGFDQGGADPLAQGDKEVSDNAAILKLRRVY